MKQAYPILEFDPNPEAIIEPSKVIKPKDIPEHCVLCFFQEVIKKHCAEKNAKIITQVKSETGIFPVYEIIKHDKRLAVVHPGVGAPLAAAVLEEMIAHGCRKFIACGVAGVLDREIAAGHIIIPAVAVRDEGTSYHYLPPGREVEATPEAVTAIEKVLNRQDVKYLVTKTWTTDAFYRETPAKVQMRQAEGCLTVEMEAAAFFAVAQFRRVQFAQLLYSGDDVSGETWDSRGVFRRSPARETLFNLAAEACLEL
ncbi:nucleoside phosphorylase [Planctomycetota bacterium]